MAHAFYPEWARRVKAGVIRTVPKGMAYVADANDGNDDDDNDDDDNDDMDDVTNSMSAMAVSRGKISATWVCMVCGGLGHASNVDGMQCLTAQLGIKIPKQDLVKIKYPNGIKYPSFSRHPSRKSSSQGSSSSSHDVKYSSRDKSNSRKHKTKDFDRKKRNDRNDRKKPYSKREGKQVETSGSEESPSQSDDSDEVPESKFASVYHTIDVRDSHYQSYSSSDEDQHQTSNHKKSATTKAKKP
jgi:hypothetical protein